MSGIVEKSNWEKLDNDRIFIYVGEKDYPKIKNTFRSKNTYSSVKNKKIVVHGMHFIVTYNDDMYKKLFKILKLTEEAEWKRPRPRPRPRTKKKG